MPQGLFNQEWLNANTLRRYPLADTASGTDISGVFQLPTSFIVALDLPVHAAMNIDPARFFLYKLGVYGTGFSITIGYQPTNGSDPVPVASAIVDLLLLVPGKTFELKGIAPFDDTSGKITIGRADDIAEQPSGYWEFAFTEGQLDPDAIRPLLRNLVSFVVRNGQEVSQRLYGDIELADGVGTQWASSQEAGQPVVFRLDAATNLNFAETCVCEGDVRQAKPIRFINDIPGDNNGKFSMLGSACVTFTPATNGLTVKNPCTEPCANCTDLESITADLQRLLSQASTVQSFSALLAANNEVFRTTVLGARLSDRGCLTGGV